MKIVVTGYMRFKAVIGDQVPLVLKMEKPTLRDALNALSRQYGKEFEDLVFDPLNNVVKRSVLVLLNGQPYLNLSGRLNSELRDGDEIALCPLMAGG
jgi:molybdopterin converting factor small subunit